jgi:hypothetical protein
MTNEKRVQDYMVRLSQLEREREDWENLWEDVVHYCLPKRDMWEKEDDQGGDQKKGRDLYDTHAVEAAKIEANGFVGWNSGPSIKWMKLKLLIEELNDLPYVKDWLELCERRLYMMFHRSGFYDQLYEFMLDLVTVGTATMLIEEDPSTFLINYSTRHPKETYIVEGPNGKIDAFYRQVWMTGSQALERYGEENLPEEWVEDVLHGMEDGKPEDVTKKYRFIHVLEKRHDRNPYSKLSKNMPIASVEMLPEKEHIIWEKGYHEMPIVCARFSKNSNEKYGRSPAMDGISTIKRANQEKYSTLKAAQLAVEPPVQVPVNMQRRLNLSPKGVNIYKNPGSRIFPVDVGSGYPFGRDVLEMLHDEIDNIFMVPLFRMLDRLDREVTAREVMERQGERVSSLSGPITRQNSEGLGPIVMRTFNIMARNRLMPPPPAMLARVGTPLDVEFTGLLAQAQRRYHQAQGLNAALSTIAGIVDMTQNPAVLDNIDWDDLIRKIAENEGMPASAIRELPEIKKLRRAREEAAARAQQQAQLESTAKSLQGLSKAPEEGSPAQGLLQGSGLV